MKVRELIEKLQEMDLDLEVVDGSNNYLENVETTIRRDPFDGDWDQYVVQLS